MLAKSFYAHWLRYDVVSVCVRGHLCHFKRDTRAAFTTILQFTSVSESSFFDNVFRNTILGICNIVTHPLNVSSANFLPLNYSAYDRHWRQAPSLQPPDDTTSWHYFFQLQRVIPDTVRDKISGQASSNRLHFRG